MGSTPMCYRDDSESGSTLTGLVTGWIYAATALASGQNAGSAKNLANDVVARIYGNFTWSIIGDSTAGVGERRCPNLDIGFRKRPSPATQPIVSDSQCGSSY